MSPVVARVLTQADAAHHRPHRGPRSPLGLRAMRPRYIRLESPYQPSTMKGGDVDV